MLQVLQHFRRSMQDHTGRPRQGTIICWVGLFVGTSTFTGPPRARALARGPKDAMNGVMAIPSPVAPDRGGSGDQKVATAGTPALGVFSVDRGTGWNFPWKITCHTGLREPAIFRRRPPGYSHRGRTDTNCRQKSRLTEVSLSCCSSLLRAKTDNIRS